MGVCIIGDIALRVLWQQPHDGLHIDHIVWLTYSSLICFFSGLIFIYITVTTGTKHIALLQAFHSLPTVPLYPVLLLGATGVLYYTINLYAFLAIGVVICFVPLQVILTKTYNKLR